MFVLSRIGDRRADRGVSAAAVWLLSGLLFLGGPALTLRAVVEEIETEAEPDGDEVLVVVGHRPQPLRPGQPNPLARSAPLPRAPRGGRVSPAAVPAVRLAGSFRHWAWSMTWPARV